MVQIAVVGAGVIGLSTAYNILTELPNAEVTVIAEKFSPNTTSDVAAGIWAPHAGIILTHHTISST